MNDLRLFVPITKIDVEKRLVYGTVTEEVMDKSGEVLDYESSKPYFEKWSQEIASATGGKSVGNLRVMHTSKAAGKLTELLMDDAEKRISCVAKVVDDSEWAKCLEGVYTGFSHGGRYVRRWTDDAGTARYTAEPAEVSLVDNPCLRTAHFEVVKADGAVEEREFKQPQEEQAAEEEPPVVKPNTDEPAPNTAEEEPNAGMSEAEYEARAKGVGLDQSREAYRKRQDAVLSKMELNQARKG